MNTFQHNETHLPSYLKTVSNPHIFIPPSPPTQPHAPPTKTDYKNAIHYGRINKNNKLQGLSTIIYDNSDILIAEFQDGEISGMYCCFIAVMEIWICGSLERGNNWDKGVSGFVYWRNGDGVVVGREGNRVGEYRFRNGRYVGNIMYKQISNHQSKQPLQKNQPQWQLQHPQHPPTPTLHLETHLKYIPTSSSTSLSPSQKPLNLYQISSNKLYYGISQQNKPSGIGIIFYNEWPVCYGNFINGQLQGLGRVEQSKNMVIDGLFVNSKMKNGWVFDYGEKCTFYGVISQSLRSKKDVFQIKEEYAGVLNQKVQKYRRRVHLQQLNFVNSYMPYYQQKLKQLFLPEHLYKIQGNNNSKNNQYVSKNKERSEINFIPSFISEISGINGSPRSRGLSHHREEDASRKAEKELIDLIMEYNETKSHHEKNSKMVASTVRNNESKQKSKQKTTIHLIGPISSQFHSRIRSRSKTHQNRILTPIKYEQKQLKPNKSGKIQNIHKIPSTARYENDKQKTNKGSYTQRKMQKRLNLQMMYNKYLKKQY